MIAEPVSLDLFLKPVGTPALEDSYCKLHLFIECKIVQIDKRKHYTFRSHLVQRTCLQKKNPKISKTKNPSQSHYLHLHIPH